MKAGQWDPKQQKVVINDIPKPCENPNQFLVKIKSASLCHSDLMMHMRPPDYAVTMGHEGVGHIVSMGTSAATHGFRVGDAIGFGYFIDCCFECEGCMVHNMHCETGNQKLQGVVVDGYFAEYAVVDWQNAIKLPETLDMSCTAPLFCAGITAFHSVDGCELEEGEWLAVVGCGGLGQYAIQYAKAMGYKTIGLDISDAQLDMAKKVGADAVFNSMTNKNYVEEVKKLTGGKGCHAAAVYSASYAAYAGAPDVLRIGGLLMVIGITPKGLDFVSTLDLVLGKYRIKADSTGIPQRMRKAVEFTGKHRIQPEVELRKIEDLPQMVEDMENGKADKRQVVVF
ncbi:AdhP Zn-dependent alcohol dehydrogenase [Pyrenophora tritici-repentis]|uniref:Alcohol dehydrogenase n=2 Tax=Pyrenophora tritici-repentis TaxID=45151 RepID=A0A2W1GF92_9PLEO|nr:alcohol dehydrogenase [Pyrenophora tritici-repentis Pt-1C-BFP]KAA8620889.1 alcohol dehydrogenase [Pyrenophora tritici-repentis]EDU43330.1 alcohol dehydrogenase [Pyrenophora tritici-repentis Pt-1C-BFP]KAF7450133.1 alcohol dehydrogenase [Pyrenophora tritici-repentis]KAF7572704.1 AdhP, Zn-dependent alcohol dehydrogenase [Pyrenophora tritici-repentis]KAG9376106.1 alcohol dehydrogenase [Pyrenophora tritici-repentis]